VAKKADTSAKQSKAQSIEAPPPEQVYRTELAFLEAYDRGARPPGFRLTPRAVAIFVMGSQGETLRLDKSAVVDDGVPRELVIAQKFIGDRSIVERAVITLAGERGLLLAGDPGTAKSMLSELLAAAISGTSHLTVQGTAGTTEEQLKYGWNYATLLAHGPSRAAVVASPVLQAMRRGAIVRVEEITRCLPEVQDALVSILSDRRLAVPELAGLAGDGEGDHVEFAAEGFGVIATANLRDRGVSEMSAALKRRFNFETIPSIADPGDEARLVRDKATAALEKVGAPMRVDDAVVEAVVTAFRDLRLGKSAEGWAVERPSSVMSTAEAVAVTSSIAMQAAYFARERDPLTLVPGYLLGVVMKDEPKDRSRLLAYWDGSVKRRSDAKQRVWQALLEMRAILEER
jgi:MoxR-like ATPase